jgi:biotin transport system substrate-specific component
MPTTLTPTLQRDRLQRMGASAVLLGALAGSLFMCACAQISVHLPFSPVPVTGQTLGVLLIGAVLGPRAAGLAMLCYLGEGAAGLPVFAGGTGGPAVLAGATAGYLWAFPAAAVVAGWLVDRLAKPYAVAPVLLALFLADGVVFAGGVGWLAVFLHTGPAQAANLGLWPYVPGDLVKIVLAAVTLQSGRELLRRLGWNAFRQGV